MNMYRLFIRRLFACNEMDDTIMSIDKTIAASRAQRFSERCSCLDIKLCCAIAENVFLSLTRSTFYLAACFISTFISFLFVTYIYIGDHVKCAMKIKIETGRSIFLTPRICHARYAVSKRLFWKDVHRIEKSTSIYTDATML